jgi:hypothetical protein
MDPKHRSRALTEGPSRAPARSYLKGIGFDDEALAKPIVAYLPQTGQLLSEYCVEFPDETRPYGSPRLPDSDDVLAKWMALQGDERRLIAEANLHLPGRQIDPRQGQRDIWRLGRWERERLERRAGAAPGGEPSPPPARHDNP